jgi:hypothetical protein
MSRTLVVILLWTSSCASYETLGKTRRVGSDPAAPSDTDGFGEDSDTAADMDEAALNTPAWFRISGDLQIIGGHADTMELVGTFFPADVSAGELTDCLLSTSLALVEEDVSQDPDLYQWWKVSFPSEETAWPCGNYFQIPAVSGIGLGAFHPELHAGVVELGLSDPALYLYGLYARFEIVHSVDSLVAGQTYVVGYAGTENQLREEQLTADAEADAVGPVGDGLYSLEGTFLLPVAPAR